MALAAHQATSSTTSTGGWSASSSRTRTTRSVRFPNGISSPERQLGNGGRECRRLGRRSVFRLQLKEKDHSAPLLLSVRPERQGGCIGEVTARGPAGNREVSLRLVREGLVSNLRLIRPKGLMSMFERTRTGLREMPSNAAWLLSRALQPAENAATDARDQGRKMTAAVVDAAPVGDSVEIRARRAHDAAERAREAEERAVEAARRSKELVDRARDVSERGRARVKAIDQEITRQVRQRVAEVRSPPRSSSSASVKPPRRTPKSSAWKSRRRSRTRSRKPKATQRPPSSEPRSSSRTRLRRSRKQGGWLMRLPRPHAQPRRKRTDKPSSSRTRRSRERATPRDA